MIMCRAVLIVIVNSTVVLGIIFTLLQLQCGDYCIPHDVKIPCNGDIVLRESKGDMSFLAQEGVWESKDVMSFLDQEGVWALSFCKSPML